MIFVNARKEKNHSSKQKFIRQAHFQDLLQPHWRRIGAGALDWRRIGAGLAQRRIGAGLAQDWRRIGAGLAPGRRIGARLAQGWRSARQSYTTATLIVNSWDNLSKAGQNPSAVHTKVSLCVKTDDIVLKGLP